MAYRGEKYILLFSAHTVCMSRPRTGLHPARGIVGWLVFLVVASIMLGAGYDAIHTCKVVIHPGCLPAPLQAPTETVNVTQPPETIYVTTTPPDPPPAPPVPSQEPEGPREKERVFLIEYEDPKYKLDVDFTATIYISSTPGTSTPWTGNGMPWFRIEYGPGMGHSFLNDTGILHNGWAVLGGYQGFDVCGYWHRYFFWDFIGYHTNASTVGPQVLNYESLPTDSSPYAYLGNGDKCTAAVLASSQWYWGMCLEGDGSLTKTWVENYETERENVTISHYDPMDYCGQGYLKFPP